MAAPNAAQRVYYRKGTGVVIGASVTLELTGIPLKGLIRRIRGQASGTSNLDLALGESVFAGFAPAGGGIDVIMRTGSVAEPFDLFADTLTNSVGAPVAGNEGIPFQLTPSSPGSTTGSLFLSWTNSGAGAADFQITIEPLFP